MPKTIVIGDIHGCYDEFRALLEKCNPREEDQIICVGDLINKGPSSRKVLDIAMKTPNLKCVVGNHEHALLKHAKAGTLDQHDKAYQKETVRELADGLFYYMNYIESWPYYLDFDDFSVIHAGIRPGIPLAEQSKKDLVYLRTLENGDAWYEDYKDKKLLVHGHWARKGLVIQENVIGLDSGCVYGKQLTAVILPERKIVSVDAKKAYAPIYP